MVILIISSVLIFIFISIQVLSFWFIHKKNESNHHSPDSWPTVSILLAARNEEVLILRSLKHLDQLDYPEGKLEILIGDDQSEDRTYELCSQFIGNKPEFKLFRITETLGNGRGKANVLANLAKAAHGEIFLITDVDVALPSQWVKAMVTAFEPDTGIVSGTTTCEPEGSMQAIDWLHFMGYIKAFANVGVACTSVGNNMAVRKSAYLQTGGYEEMEFSITEDYRLFQQVTSRAWGWKNLLSKNTLGKATAINSFKELLHQRKRWLIGAADLPWNWKALIVCYGLFIPAWIGLFCFEPTVALSILLIKWILQSLFISRLCQLSGLEKFNWLKFFAYEFYIWGMTLGTIIFYLLPIDAIWKGRRYSSKDLR